MQGVAADIPRGGYPPPQFGSEHHLSKFALSVGHGWRVMAKQLRVLGVYGPNFVELGGDHNDAGLPHGALSVHALASLPQEWQQAHGEEEAGHVVCPEMKLQPVASHAAGGSHGKHSSVIDEDINGGSFGLPVVAELIHGFQGGEIQLHDLDVWFRDTGLLGIKLDLLLQLFAAGKGAAGQHNVAAPSGKLRCCRCADAAGRACDQDGGAHAAEVAGILQGREVSHPPALK
mmetsp:Transcript_16566/g.46227  ORF Transcript_16566/g.46227 Transcript_16566/m.46227 type:complete len:231 (-) Transcript_16566:213-905(-)